MPGRVNWHAEQWKRAEFLPGLKRNMSAAGVYLSGEIKADISQPGTLRYATGKTKKGKLRQKTIYNFTHSRPGNPPYKQKGRLRASITWELVGLITRVGTNYLIGRYLELGTRRMAARPYLRATLMRKRAIITAIITRRIKPGQLPARFSNQFRSGHFGAGAAKAGYG